MSRLTISRYEPEVVWVRFIIWRTCSAFIDGPHSRKLDCVSEPPDLCMETDAKSAPAAIAETGIFSPK